MAGSRTYGTLGHDHLCWHIGSIEPHVSIRLKQVFPKIPKTATPPYRITRNLATDADMSWFLDRYPLEMAESTRSELTKRKRDFKRQQYDLERILLPDYKCDMIPAGLNEGEEIRAYQMQAVEILQQKGNLLLGDDGGLGKTYTAAAFLISTLDSLPAAVVVETHLQKQWAKKLKKFTTLRVHIIKKAHPYNLPEADVYIFRYSQVAGWADIFATGMFRAAIYDEPQSLRRGTQTEKGKACKVLSENAAYRMGLTATPIYNYGDEMWHVMQFIDELALGSWDEFSREWCTQMGNGKWRVSDPKALGTYLREAYVLLRRTKADVKQQLPAVQRIVEYIDYDHKAVAAVEDLARQLAIKATTGSFVERGAASRDLDVMMRQVTGVAKAKTVAMFARMIVEAGEPVIIWGWHREVYSIWLQELADLKPAMFTGSESPSQKEKEKQRFMDGETDVLIMSLRSGAGADELQYRCSTGIFGELDWSPGIHQQCIWRLDREGQLNPVSAFFLVTEDGSDPPIMDVLGLKASEATQITDPFLGVELKENDTSNLRRLVERYLGKRGVEMEDA